VKDLHQVDLLDAARMTQAWTGLAFKPEVVLAGELLEHLDSPGSMLRICGRQMPAASRLAVTVPNAFSLRSFLHVGLGYEKVAADHVAYYSLASLRALARRCGFQLTEVRWCRYAPKRSRPDQAAELLIRPLLRLWPQLSEGILAVLRPCEGPADRSLADHRATGESLPAG
jgi:hypothetical protein